jgi:hypothetical protein
MRGVPWRVELVRRPVHSPAIFTGFANGFRHVKYIAIGTAQLTWDSIR